MDVFWQETGSGVDEFEALGERLQLIGTVPRPVVVSVVGRRDEVGPVALVHEHHRHLSVTERLHDELLSHQVRLGVDGVEGDTKLVELSVRCVTLDARVLAENSHGHEDSL